MGDYCSGTNHVLPTYGYARAYSGLSVLDFVKRMTVQELTPAGLRALGPTAVTLAELEGLDAHASAVTRRLALLERMRASMSWISDLARPDIVALSPTSTPRGSRRSSACTPTSCPGVRSATTADAGLNRYPEPQPRELVARSRRSTAPQPNQVLVGRGSDEAIDLLVRAFCRAGQDAVLVCPPTFGMYAVAARIQGAEVVTVPLRSRATTSRSTWTRSSRQCTPSVKLVFLCSPNNPTGNLLERSGRAAHRRATRRPRARRGRRGLRRVCDAAESRPACRQDLPQLVILRTLSKAHGLAGARCGTLIANPEIIALLRKVIPPYAITQLTVEAVLKLLRAAAARHHACPASARSAASASACRRRCASCRASSACGRAIRTSCSSSSRDPQIALAARAAANLLIRDVRAQVGLPRTLRISVGTPEQNDRLLGALR